MFGKRLGALALVLAASVWHTAVAVDRSKFRTCQQGSFCRRFKSWITRPDRDEALWSILPDSKVAEGSTVTYKIQHKHEADPHLLLKLDAYASGTVRIRVNEIDPVVPRHVIPAGDVVADPAPKPASGLKVTADATSSKIAFTTASGVPVIVVMKHSPMSFLVTANGRMIQNLNARNFFNFERYRQPKQVRPPDAKAIGPGADAVTIDSAQHMTVDRKGLWEEDFGGHTDRKPRGPASLGMDVSFLGNVPGLYGLSEHMTKANLPFYEEPYRFFNLDVFEYENNEPMALYGAIPFLWAIHSSEAGSATSGFLWINPSETFVKLERDAADAGPAHTWWTSESGVMDVAVFVGPTPAALSAQFHDLTGHAPLAPLWALGKHQCRWNYMTQRDVATVDASFDKYDIPYDVIWLDIEHTDGKAYFTWNSASFPDPSAMMQGISDKRRKFVNVVDPHIKKDTNFRVYTDIRDKGLFTKKVDWKTMDDPTDSKPADWVEEPKIADPNATQPDVWDEEQDGKWVPPQIDNPAYKGFWKAKQMTDPNSPQSDFEGWCWPGTSSYPDFTNPAMREYWGSQFAFDKYKGTNQDLYVWNDMNEPSVFNGPEVTMARDTIHPHGNVEHRDVHNMYGYYVHRATFEGLAKRTPGDRPFVLTRSFFIGSHKYAAIWTGDNTASWEHLRTSIAMIGALTLGGQSLVGADIGGFFKHPDAEMVTRWYQLGVLLYPFLRNHAHLETPRREPYMYDETTMHRVRDSLKLRYKMLPYLYTVYHAYHTKGEPVVRPLFWDFLDDKMTHTDEVAVEDQIMFGPAVLARGVSAPMSEASHGNVYLPVTVPAWYSLYTGDVSTAGVHDVAFTMENVPAYVRSGAILPLKSRMRRSSSCMALDPFTLNVYLDPDTGASTGRVYIDDYKTHAYTQNDNFLDVDLAFAGGALKASAVRGKLTSDVATDVEKVEIFGLKAAAKSATLSVKGASHSLPVPISRAIGTYKGSTLYAAVVKVKPWINLADRSGWSLSVA